MTVSQIRDLMMERVVPESLLPQNIAACLIDEDAAPPELDAFTFLNRLRSLGIGSADFLYLLKGCGAPDEAVEKIEQHPDMNLQSLIVTLDGSGLTPKDYTRMLYTARQLWERTITMRLELDESQEQPSEDPEQVQPVRTARQRRKEDNEFHEYAGVKPIGKHEELPSVEPEETEKLRPRTARQRKKTEQEFREYAGVKPIGRRGESEEADKPERTDVYTAVQLKLPPEIVGDTPEESAEPEQNEHPLEDSPAARRKAIIACIIGAAVVCAADAAVGFMGFSAPQTGSTELHFAVDNSEVFTEIYKAYTNARIGGGCVQPESPAAQVFGDLLVTGSRQLGSFSDGNSLWAAEPDVISVYDISGVADKIEILPPDGAQFVRVEFTGNGLTAVFTGDSFCGVMGADEDGKTWTSTQCGKLTDIYSSGDSIRLGSVYTPAFSESFTVDDELAYMPWTEYSGERTAILPAETAVTGKAQGCSYAVNSEYSANGEIKTRMAVLGNPIYSGAEFFSAVMYDDTQTLIVAMDGKSELIYCNTAEAVAAACGNSFTATAEKSDNGVTVYIRDRDLKIVSAFNADSSITTMKFDGDSLLLGDKEKVTLAVDLSDAASPVPLELTAADGVVNGDYALCGSTASGGITLTLYKLDNGKAVQADSFSKTLTAAELESFTFSGANTTVVNGTECCGAAYSWFDGVSVVSEFSEMGRSRSVRTLYDDPDGFTAAAYTNDGLVLICGDRIQK